MNSKLCILVCQNFLREAERIVVDQKMDDVSIRPFLPSCNCPGLQSRMKQDQTEIDQGCRLPDTQMAAIGSCFQNGAGGDVTHNMDPRYVLRLDQCFYMLVSRRMVDHLISQGAYLLTPGWLDAWREHIQEWGFDQPTAREFFHECIQKFVLLDTGVHPQSLELFQEFTGYIDMPGQVIPVGLDQFELYLSRIVEHWRLEKTTRHLETALAETRRKSADYEMAFDLLTHLTQIHTEEQAVQGILNLFTMLFASGSIEYYPVVDDQIVRTKIMENDPVFWDGIQKWVENYDEDYAWTPDGDGFFVRINHTTKTVGVVKVGSITMPQLRQQYLNLALSISRLCGLTVANARTYSALRNAESIARREKEITEGMRQTITDMISELDMQQVLNRILVYLEKVLSFSQASVYLLENDMLRMVAGRGFADGLMPVGDTVSKHFPHFDEMASTKMPVIVPNIQSDELVDYMSAGLHGWIGIPLISRGDVMGFISLASSSTGSFSASDILLANSFANEATIAIENARLFREIQVLAVSDPLTGLYNRRFFFERLEAEMKRSERYNHPLSIIMLDLDHFKNINDQFGHVAGDRVLAQVAETLRQGSRASDLCGRFGGEEFILMLPETDTQQARIAAERIRQMIEQMALEYRGQTVCVTASVGVARLEPDCRDLEDFLRRCDEALYTSKRNGRNCVSVFGE